MDNNQRMRAISIALCFDRSDIAAACKAGGYNASRAKASHWSRGAGKELHKGAEYTPTGYTEYEPMPDIAFDAFCLGIAARLDELDSKADRKERAVSDAESEQY